MDKALRYLGLAVRAGRLVVGAEDCARELRRRRGGLVIAAADAGGSALEQTSRLCGARGTPMLGTAYTKQQLGRAVGRDGPVAVAYICDEGLAKAFMAAVEKVGEQEERV